MNREKFCGTLLSEEENTRAKREWGIAMLRIIIADDEFDIVELCRALITYPGAEIVGESCNGIELLKKIGFHRDNPEDGPILVMQGFVDEDKEINICPVIKMIYEKESMCT